MTVTVRKSDARPELLQANSGRERRVASAWRLTRGHGRASRIVVRGRRLALPGRAGGAMRSGLGGIGRSRSRWSGSYFAGRPSILRIAAWEGIPIEPLVLRARPGGLAGDTGAIVEAEAAAGAAAALLRAAPPGRAQIRMRRARLASTSSPVTASGLRRGMGVPGLGGQARLSSRPSPKGESRDPDGRRAASSPQTPPSPSPR